MSAQGTTLAFVKGAFYKTCFCIGLGTASYYSYAQVQTWVGDKTAPVAAIDSSTGMLQEKVNNLTASPASAQSITTTQSVQQMNPALARSLNGTYHANPHSYLTLVDAKKADAPTADANAIANPPSGALAAASPSGSPGVSPSPGEASVEKKEGEEKKPEGEAAGVAVAGASGVAASAPPAVTGPVNEIGLPYMPFANQQAPAQAPDAKVMADANPASAFAAQAAAASYGGGIPVASTNGNSNSGTEAAIPEVASSSNTSVSVSPTYSTSIPTTYTNTGLLSSADLSALTSPIKGFFTDQTENVSGLLVTLGDRPGVVIDQSRTNQYPVHTNRWAPGTGLVSDAGFVVRAISGAGQVQVSFNLKLQDLSQNTKDLSLQAIPTQTLVHVESRNNKFYKVFEMKLPDLTTSTGEHLSNLMATLVYEESTVAGAATLTMTMDSNLTFTRAHVETLGTVWDSTGGTNRVPASNEQEIVADAVSYSMSLEKSP